MSDARDSTALSEYNFDGLCGPTHNYAGLSPGNLASERHQGGPSNPKAAALQGLRKMRRLVELGVGQAFLLPQARPELSLLRRCGFRGTDAQVLRDAARSAPKLLWQSASASAMWTANAATVAPSADTDDGLVHLTPANLVAMLHRSLESPGTERVLRGIFECPGYFSVESALPSHHLLGDEGAANHTRLETTEGTVQLFAWGRSAYRQALAPRRYPARQSLEASEAIARKNRVRGELALFWQQDPRGIDAGAFHTDVLAVGHQSFLMLHELSFVDTERLLDTLRARLGESFRSCVASEQELPIADAVAAYPFNSQIVTLTNGEMCIVAPTEARANEPARRFLERVVSEDNPVRHIEYLEVRQSMANGGGPACLRLRVALTRAERNAITARVFLNAELLDELEAWVRKHYRDQLTPDDLRDPSLLDESQRALDELTQLTGMGAIYDFQRYADGSV